MSACCQMNDVLLYTYPQQDGKYRLKNTLPLTGLKVSLKIRVSNAQSPAYMQVTSIKAHGYFKNMFEFLVRFFFMSGCLILNDCSGQ